MTDWNLNRRSLKRINNGGLFIPENMSIKSVDSFWQIIIQALRNQK